LLLLLLLHFLLLVRWPYRSQLAIAEKHALHDDNNHEQNDVGSTAASTKTMMSMMMPAAPTIASKTNSISPDLSLNSIPVGENCAKDMDDRPNPLEYLTYFNCGHVTQYKNGTLLRHSSLIISENKIIPISDINTNDSVLFHAWTFNDTIPGPTMRMTEGIMLRLRFIILNPRSILTLYICTLSIQEQWMEYMAMGDLLVQVKITHTVL
jgi:hypothetical protein